MIGLTVVEDKTVATLPELLTTDLWNGITVMSRYSNWQNILALSLAFILRLALSASALLCIMVSVRRTRPKEITSIFCTDRISYDFYLQCLIMHRKLTFARLWRVGSHIPLSISTCMVCYAIEDRTDIS